MSKMTISFVAVSASTGLMLWDYAMSQPSVGLMLLPAFFSGGYMAIAAAHLLELIKQNNKKD
jgi:uncharacterized protein involved in exopolysaccharide biosynthesis